MSTNTNSKIKLNMDSLKSRREWKRHKVKDGNNLYRILPPFGESSQGYPYRKWQIIWGLKDAESGRMRPYASSMTSEKKCPVDEYVRKLKSKAETLKAQLIVAGVDEETAKERAALLSKVAQELSPKTVYIYNAADKSGEVGLLELKATAHKKMKSEMQNYIQVYNQDPTSLNSAVDDSGVWFNITRSGLGRDTEYDVQTAKSKAKDASGEITFRADRSALPENIVENYDNLGYDLGSVYQVKSYDELVEILEANLPDIYALCPDADLSADVTPVKKDAPVAAAPKVQSKVALKLDDEADDEEVVAAPAKTTTAKAKPVAQTLSDDDFMAEAEALLNG